MINITEFVGRLLIATHRINENRPNLIADAETLLARYRADQRDFENKSQAVADAVNTLTVTAAVISEAVDVSRRIMRAEKAECQRAEQRMHEEVSRYADEQDWSPMDRHPCPPKTRSGKMTPVAHKFCEGCSICKECTGYLNVERHHFGYCEDHKRFWWIGSNLSSKWRGETHEVWLANIEFLEALHRTGHGPTPREILKDEDAVASEIPF